MPYKKPEIICEIASAHGGDTKKLRQLINYARQSGADWVKLQIFKYESLVENSNNAFDDLKIIEIKQDLWGEILKFCENFTTKIIAEVYDQESFDFVKGFKSISAYKIPTADINDKEFCSNIFQQGKPVFVGIGGASIKEIDELIKLSDKFSCQIKLIHGIQSFPTKVKDSFLEKISLFSNRYQVEVGYADHIDAENKLMSFSLSAMSIAAGASFIEKHITLNRSEKGYDYYSALNPIEFKEFVNFIKLISKSIKSNPTFNLSKSEKIYRNKMKKFAVLSDDVSKGEILKDTSFQFKRTSKAGLTRLELSKFLNHSFKLNLKKGNVINSEYLEK